MIPATARIETHGREHGEYYNCTESRSPSARANLHQAVKVCERSEQDHHKDIQHLPLANELDDFIQPRSGSQLVRALTLHSDDKHAQGQ